MALVVRAMQLVQCTRLRGFNAYHSIVLLRETSLLTILRYTEWRKSSGDKYCTGTSTCQASTLTGTQVCQTRSTTISGEVGGEILKGVNVGVTVSFELSDQNCYSASDTTACIWSDGGCHVVWTQQQIIKQVGYMRKRCDWGDGDETECMTNWEQKTPSKLVNYGCGSKCTDTNTCGHSDGTPC